MPANNGMFFDNNPRFIDNLNRTIGQGRLPENEYIYNPNSRTPYESDQSFFDDQYSNTPYYQATAQNQQLRQRAQEFMNNQFKAPTFSQILKGQMSEQGLRMPTAREAGSMALRGAGSLAQNVGNFGVENTEEGSRFNRISPYLQAGGLASSAIGDSIAPDDPQTFLDKEQGGYRGSASRGLSGLSTLAGLAQNIGNTGVLGERLQSYAPAMGNVSSSASGLHDLIRTNSMEDNQRFGDGFKGYLGYGLDKLGSVAKVSGGLSGLGLLGERAKAMSPYMNIGGRMSGSAANFFENQPDSFRNIGSAMDIGSEGIDWANKRSLMNNPERNQEDVDYWRKISSLGDNARTFSGFLK
jgi:hypothetical protein